MSERPTPEQIGLNCITAANHDVDRDGRAISTIADSIRAERADADRRVAEERERVRAVLSQYGRIPPPGTAFVHHIHGKTAGMVAGRIARELGIEPRPSDRGTP